ncbi:OmpA family protein [Alphaproteobacteria bacterium KMM 3653]|uniref:OmpA family protein n=1 Tax=Harenicola maris TaxID=2841044 RepID=A0AAP2CQ03_9RHOB|nr:OmpA family protein [Harenicola maris]
MIRLFALLSVVVLALPTWGEGHLGCAPTLADPLGLLGDCARPAAAAPVAQARGIVDRRANIDAEGFPFAIREDHIFFLSGGARVSEAEQQRITQLANVLKTSVLRNACLRLVGHGDTSGPAEANQTVSLSRARAVETLLGEALGAPERIVEVVGAGETAPLAEFEPTAPEQRRVAIYARSCSAP